MATRLVAVGILVASALIAWVAISFPPAARALQLGIVASVVYVGYLAWRGWRTMRAALARPAAAAGRDELTVGVIVPARDEAASIGSVVRDLLAQTHAQLEIVVVDDASIDGTGDAARSAAGGEPRVRVVRREAGTGPATKGGALAFATPLLSADVVAVIDADTRLRPDFVARCLAAWRRDPAAVALQAQRRADNASRSWLTRCQDDEQLIDMASQCGRWAIGGAAELRGNGMWVRAATLDALGGWNGEALTEDLDLATRLSATGHHVTLAPEASVAEEAVETLGALWRQRLRWCEGSLRRLMEHGPRMLGGDQPPARKIDFLLFTAEFLLPPLFVTAVAASLVTVALPRSADWTVPASLFVGYGTGSFLLALAGLSATGHRRAALVAEAARGALFLSHWLVVVPVALARIAASSRRSAFVRTPRARHPRDA